MRLSLKHKALLTILAFAIALSGITVYVSSWVVTGIIQSNYEEKATDLSKTVALSLNPRAAAVLRDEILERYHAAEKTLSEDGQVTDAYMSHFTSLDAAAEYVELERALQSYQALNGAEAVYLACVDEDTATGICMVDASKEAPLSAGFPERLSSADKAVLSDADLGFAARTRHTPARGELVTAGAPIYGNSNQVVCYAMVDLSTKAMHTQQFDLVALLLALIFGLTVLICFAAIFMINRGVISPINLLSEAALRYCQEGDVLNHQQFSKLDIRTGDEIESLSNSMKQMENDINDNVAHLLATTRELSSTRKEKEALSTIATRDSMTGVRNKYAYSEELVTLEKALEEGDEKFGFAVVDLNNLKILNDTYGHDKGDLAIIRLCRTICSVFAHSPVFRIGGDEFVVLLKNTDYDNIQLLAESFNNAMFSHDSNGDQDPWESITASLGYALYDPEKDTGIDTVFHRADSAMYKQKKRMKAERA